VSALGSAWFEAALVPHTLQATNLSDRRPGDAVNLEVDLLARYLEGLLAARGPRRR
jgi:riboflavin synthase